MPLNRLGGRGTCLSVTDTRRTQLQGGFGGSRLAPPARIIPHSQRWLARLPYRCPYQSQLHKSKLWALICGLLLLDRRPVKMSTRIRRMMHPPSDSWGRRQSWPVYLVS